MYGVEAQSMGSGGLAAQAPYPDRYLASAVGISSARNLMGGIGYGVGGNTLPYSLPLQTDVALPVQQAPVGAQKQGWQSVLDWHNSPAAWILAAILLLYGWLHLSVRARAGHAHAGFGV